jgi:fructose-1,6-bisphosphatase/sedoheptulose 1,7-bisphosphatase-like protein
LEPNASSALNRLPVSQLTLLLASHHRHGLDAKTVTQAAAEVAAVLDGDLPSSTELLDIG